MSTGARGLDAEELRQRALAYHREHRGKIEVIGKVPLVDRGQLSLAYTPGVAEPCREIARDAERVYDYTIKGNLVAVVSDGTAVLGLGDIGPAAALPVMEGKALLFKVFAGVDAVPICLDAREVDRLVDVIRALEPTFGGINLEDIAAPRCFEVEARLREELSIPIFHDDQHGTAIVTAAALLNALRVVGKALEQVTVVINGAGAAGLATARLLVDMGAGNVIVCDTRGALYPGRPYGMNAHKEELARITNPERRQGDLAEVLRGADVFVGVSAAGALTADMVRRMARDPIVMAMANPDPEIPPHEALAAGARIVCTGRSDYPNQINNVLAFPGVFRGALDVRAREINEPMKRAAARALAGLVSEEELKEGRVIPSVWDRRVAATVAAAVAEAAIMTGVARLARSPEEIYAETLARVGRTLEEAAQVFRPTAGATEGGRA